jgi:hypothetical protein
MAYPEELTLTPARTAYITANADYLAGKPVGNLRELYDAAVEEETRLSDMRGLYDERDSGIRDLQQAIADDKKVLEDLAQQKLQTVEPTAANALLAEIGKVQQRIDNNQLAENRLVTTTPEQMYEERKKAAKWENIKQLPGKVASGVGKVAGAPIGVAGKIVGGTIGAVDKAVSGAADAAFGEGTSDAVKGAVGGVVGQALEAAPQESPEQNALRQRQQQQELTAAELEERKNRAKGEADRNVQAMAGQWTEAAANNAANVAAAAQGGDTGGGAAIARMAAAQHARDTEGAANQQRAQQRADTYEREIGQRAETEQAMRDTASATQLKGINAQQKFNNLNAANKAQEAVQDQGDAQETTGPTQDQMGAPQEVPKQTAPTPSTGSHSSIGAAATAIAKDTDVNRAVPKYKTPETYVKEETQGNVNSNPSDLTVGLEYEDAELIRTAKNNGLDDVTLSAVKDLMANKTLWKQVRASDGENGAGGLLTLLRSKPDASAIKEAIARVNRAGGILP